MIVLDESDWRERARRHEERIRPWIEPRLERRRVGERHPVDDFMFEYYSCRPGQLLRWHPGAGVRLTGDVSQWQGVRGYVVTDRGASIDSDAVNAPLIADIERLLRSTAERQEQYGCFGRHEWAMVYRMPQDEVRHAQWPLRLTPDQIADVVESAPLRCTHFDAFRFYSDAARPLNIVQPTRATASDLEQPGCLHATMDLYKWAFRAYPVISADLIADCFELAREVREIDMRAAPYDLSDLGVEPLRIETTAGRAEFVLHQRDFAGRGAVLRDRLAVALGAALMSQA